MTKQGYKTRTPDNVVMEDRPVPRIDRAQSTAKSAPLPTTVPIPRPRPENLGKQDPERCPPGTNPLGAKTGPMSADGFKRQATNEVVVGKGDTLSAIAGRVLGDENRWEELFDANRDKIRDPHRLAEGMTIRLPGAEGATPTAPATGADGPCQFDPSVEISRESILEALDEAKHLANDEPTTYTAKKGDSLSRIASRLLGDAGRWQEILNANPDVLTRPEGLQPGMVLKMPDGAKQVLKRNATEAGEEGPVQSGQLWDMAREFGRKYNLDPRLIMAVVQKESGGNPRARSGAGARGLMQLMPGTARELGVTDSYNARQNMDGGARYLKQLMRDFGDTRLALMAYNWGPGNVRSYVRGRKKPPAETRNYVPAVLAYYRQFGGKA